MPPTLELQFLTTFKLKKNEAAGRRCGSPLLHFLPEAWTSCGWALCHYLVSGRELRGAYKLPELRVEADGIPLVEAASRQCYNPAKSSF